MAGRVRVKILRATDLQSSDANGKSDPYAKVVVARGNTFIEDPYASLQWKSTPKKTKTLNPVWEKDNEFTLDVNDAKHQKLWFLVYDYDRIGGDDNLGATCTSFYDLKAGTKETRNLQLAGGSKKRNTGNLFIEIEALGFDGPESFPPRIIPHTFRDRVTVGPLLNFRGQDLINKTWRVSMMIGVPTTGDPLAEHSVTLQGATVTGEVIYQTSKKDLTFIVYNLTILQNETEQKVLYSVDNTNFGFLVPALGQSTRWAYWSCNGYQSLAAKKKLNGIQPMWRHLQNTGDLHMMYGGGDQLYMDGIIADHKTSNLVHEGIFSLPLLQEWMVKPDGIRMEEEFSPVFHEQVYEFAVQHYIDQFTEQDFCSALATLPSIMSWDDHDGWDGMGSYKHLNDCKIFKGMFPIMQELYLLFQHHTTRERAAADCDMFGYQGYSTLHYIDDGATALLSFDTRSERTANQIVSPKTYEIGWQKLNELPAQLKHFLLMIPVPIAYPDMFLIDTVFAVGDKVSLVDSVLNRIPGVKNEFDYEMRDDFLDHWNHHNHEEERDLLIEKIFSIDKNIRVTIISGDVHHMAVGKLKNKSTGQVINNIVCSAIGNAPPSNVEAKFLKTMSFLHKVSKDVSMELQTKFDRIKYPYGDQKNKYSNQVINKRNFSVWEQDSSSHNFDVLFFTERSHHAEFPQMISMTIEPR